MNVVTASVHDPRLARGVAQIRLFGDGEGVHIGANCQSPTVGSLTFEVANHPSSTHAFAHVDAARGENPGDVSCGLVFLSAEFGVGVNVTADFDQAGCEVVGELFDSIEHS
jgi:hypothetical protein